MRIIAEIGTAHRGEIRRAEKLIRAAARAGADCAKFQLVYAREILHPATGSVELPGGAVPLYEVFRSLERDAAFYRELKNLTEAEGLSFLASPFGLESARLLRTLSPGEVKIASPEVNHIPLLEEVALWAERVILSSGVSRLGDLETALDILGRERTTLLHCVTSYPAPAEEYNLGVLPHLSALLGVETGVSDHSLDPLLVPGTALLQGAVMLEKHFTLSREDAGLDDPIALDPEDFEKMVRFLRELESLPEDSRRARLEEACGARRVAGVVGSGRKELAPSERENYGRTNRSLHAAAFLKAGTVLTRENTAVLRTEKILRPGLSPLLFESLLGAVVQRDIPAGEGILWEDLLERGD